MKREFTSQHHRSSRRSLRQSLHQAVLIAAGISVLLPALSACRPNSIRARERLPLAPQSCDSTKAWVDRNSNYLDGIFLSAPDTDFTLVLDRQTIAAGPGDPRHPREEPADKWGLYFTNLKTVYNASLKGDNGSQTGIPSNWVQIGQPPNAASTTKGFLDIVLDFCANSETPVFQIRSLSVDKVTWYLQQIKSAKYCDFSEKFCEAYPRRAK